MSRDFRRVALVAALLGLLVSLYLALRDDGGKGVPSSGGSAASNVVDVDATGGEIVRSTVARGRRVVLQVTADAADRVHVHGYDLSANVAPGRPAKIQFTADVVGRFDVELEERHELVAVLTVEP